MLKDSRIYCPVGLGLRGREVINRQIIHAISDPYALFRCG